MAHTRTGLILALLTFAALSRVLPHPPNVSAFAATAVFAGAYLQDWRRAGVLVLAAYVLSDLFLGAHGTMPFVYVALGISVWLGQRSLVQRTAVRVVSVNLMNSLVFFAISNAGVWLTEGLYPATFNGLLTCYIAAIPFLQYSVLGDLAYAAALFGAWALADMYRLRNTPIGPLSP
jgi:hypothetical protein